MLMLIICLSVYIISPMLYSVVIDIAKFLVIVDFNACNDLLYFCHLPQRGKVNNIVQRAMPDAYVADESPERA